MNFAMGACSIPLSAIVGELGVGVPDDEIYRCHCIFVCDGRVGAC